MTGITAAIRKSAIVRQTSAEAFELFTHRMGEWWPLATHSVGLQDSASVAFEPGVGGRIVETTGRGEACVWGTVLDWEPPARVRFSWHPGRAPSEATEVEVTFVETTAGTLVELVHTGWDRRPDGADARRDYDPGWDLVFGRFAAAGSGALVSPDAT